MKTRTVCLPPGRLQPGMAVAASILSQQGEELLPASCVLDEAMIDSLRRRMVHSVLITVPDERDPAQILREIETEEKRLAYIFRGDCSEARSDLHRAVSQFRRQQSQ